MAMKKHMNPKLRGALVAAGVLAAVLIAAYNFLLSSYSVRNLWVPLAADKAHCRIDLKGECSGISLLFGETFSANKISAAGTGFEAKLDSLRVSARLIRFLFTRKLTVDSLELDSLEFRNSAPEGEPPHAAPARRKNPSSAAVPGTLPVELKHLKISDGDFFLEYGEKKFTLENLELSLEDLAAGSQFRISGKAVTSGKLGRMEFAPAPLSLKLDGRMPASGVIPASFDFRLETGAASVSGPLVPAGSRWAFSAGAAGVTDGKKLKIARCFLEASDRTKAPLMKGSGTGEFNGSNGDCSGKITLEIPGSPMADAVLSELGIKSSGVSGKCTFAFASAGLDRFKARYSGMVRASSIFTVPKPELDWSISASGRLRSGETEISSAGLNLKSDSVLMADFVLPEPGWKVGDWSAFPAFTLRTTGLPLRFLGRKEGREKLTLLLVSEKNRLSLDAMSDLAVCGIAPLAVSLRANAASGVFTFSDSRVLLGSAAKGVRCGISGNFTPATPSCALTFDTTVTDPGALTDGRFFARFPVLKNETTFTLDGAKGGAFSGSLNSVTGAWGACASFKGAVSESAFSIEKASLNVFGPEHSTSTLEVSGMYPFREGVAPELSVHADFFAAPWFRAFSVSVPEKLDVSGLEALCDLAFRNRQCVSSFEVRNLVLPEWESGKNSRAGLKGSFEFMLQDKIIRVTKSGLAMKIGESSVLDLSAAGEYQTDHSKKPPYLGAELRSSAIDALALQKFAALFRRTPAAGAEENAGAAAQPAAVPAVPAGSVPGALNLSAYNGVVKFKLAGITYTPGFAASVGGSAVIRGNAIEIHKPDFQVNGRSALLDLALDAGASDGWIFYVESGLERMPFTPLLAAVPGNGGTPAASGMFDTLSFRFRGKGFSRPEMARNLNGVLSFKVSDVKISVPAAQNSPAVRLVCLPLEMTPQLTANMGKVSGLSNEIQTFSSGLTQILNGEKTLNFDSGTGDILVSGGQAVFRKFNFTGSVIQREELNASVGLADSSLRLNSRMTAVGIIVPILMQGTVNSPEFLLRQSMTQFLVLNGKKMLDPNNLNDTIHRVNDVIEIFRKH